MSKRAGICLASGIYPPESGGPAKFTATFSSWVTENSDISVSVVTLTDGASGSETVDGIKIVKISRNQNLILRYLKTAIAIRKNSSREIHILANGLFLETAIASLLGGRKYFTKIPGDIVWERARNSGRTTLDINTFQSSKLSLKYQLFRKAFSYSLKRSKRVIVPSTQLRELALSWGVAATKLHLIFNSISTYRFEFKPAANKKYDVISVCRLVPWKGLAEVIRVCSQLNLSLAVAGSGPELGNLKKLATSLETTVDFLGEISQAKLPEFYASSRFFVLNSNFEATSYSLLEARSCGVFSIANANTGSGEVISHLKDGILCGEETGVTIFDALKYAIENPNFCNSAINLAREVTVSDFEMNINFKKILKLVTNE